MPPVSPTSCPKLQVRLSPHLRRLLPDFAGSQVLKYPLLVGAPFVLETIKVLIRWLCASGWGTGKPSAFLCLCTDRCLFVTRSLCAVPSPIYTIGTPFSSILYLMLFALGDGCGDKTNIYTMQRHMRFLCSGPFPLDTSYVAGI